MAESVVYCVIHSLELLIHEAQFLHGIHGQLEQIRTKLRRLQRISKFADAKQDEDERIHDWVADTREVAYDVEDYLEIFAVEIASRKEQNVFKRSAFLWKEVKSLHHLGPKIQDIETRISDLEKDLRVSHITSIFQGEISSPRSERRQQLRRSYSHHEEDFVGLEEDVEKLVAELVKEDGNKCCHVVSIVGMGGIGKTALARKVYHHADVRSHFHAIAWACISRQWHPEDVMRRILNKLVPERREQINTMKDIAELVRELFEVQKRKKCLVVLDDIWEKDVWGSLRPAFPNKKLGSRVIVTTRNKEIARDIDTDTTCFLYEQRFLNEKESWELLLKKAFAGTNIAGNSVFKCENEDGRSSTSSTDSFHSCLSENEEDVAMGNLKKRCPEDVVQDMEKLGKEMVGQCGGLPLAIIVLGGLLMTKSTLSEWKTVHQNFNSYLTKDRSLGENGKVYEVLALSYHDLPYQVKPCFLYLGNFPEDYKISTRKLYQLWAAEGFIFSDSYQVVEEKSIMDMAELYLHELKQRCMVQVQVEESTRQFKSCQLHDLTRELCLLKGKEENFLKRIPFPQEPELMGSWSSSSRTSASITRRLSVTVDSDFETYFPLKQENLDRVRSALFFSGLTDRTHHPSLTLLCSGFKLLRVLDLERFDFGRKLSHAIGNLIHLRYLSLRGSQFYKLPSSVGKLKFLQTLDLRVPFFVCMTIPDVLWKLSNLRHLYLPPSHKSKDKLKLSTLSKLEILKNFDTRVSDVRDIPKLTRLQKLSAIFSLQMENMEAINNYLKKKSNRLRDSSFRIRDSSFRIRYDFKSDRDLTLLREIVGYTHLRKMDLIGSLKNLPEHGQFSKSLTTLTLRNSRLEEDPMAVLENLPELYSLVLRRDVFLGSEIHCSSTGFRGLKTLEVQGITTLKNWRMEKGAMPNLLYLKIDECVNLEMVPEGIQFVTTIRELVIANMPEAFKRRVLMVQKEGGEDFYKVEHITSITIIDNSRGLRESENQLTASDFSGLLRNFYPSIVPKEWKDQ